MLHFLLSPDGDLSGGDIVKQWMMPAGATNAGGLQLETVEVPEPGPGVVRLRVEALALNARDVMILAGPFGRLAHQGVVPMSDLAGVIDAIGEGVTGWGIGDAVTRVHVPGWVGGTPVPFGIGPGSLDDPGAAAEYVLVDAATVVAAPSNLTSEEAATVQVAGVTAWNALFGSKPVTAGDRVLILGSGGVSLFALQLARAVGADVFVGVRHDADDPRWIELGASLVVLTTDADWSARVLQASGGITKVVNSVGTGVLSDCLATLRAGGEVAVAGLFDLAPPQVDVLSMIAKQTSIRGVAVGSAQMHRDLSAFIERFDIHPIIDRRYPFEQLPDAFAAAVSGVSVFGKTVIRIEAH
jgi:NADPH:quinone reductase-like Zn-dependent oxidoreductase